MITASQIRQARAHLNLDQTKVCEDCDINKTTLSNIENEKSGGNASTLSKLQLYYEGLGLEFIEGDGVRKAPTGVKYYRGSSEFRQFYNDLYETTKSLGGDIWLYNGVSDLVLNNLGKEFLAMHVERMLKIKDRFRYRVVVKEGDDSFLGSSYCEYKWLPADMFNDKTIFVYGSKVAFLNFDNDDVLVVVLDQVDTAETMRHFIEDAWETKAFDP
jgi:transcriptional regulator with XRE-family HTH domain